MAATVPPTSLTPTRRFLVRLGLAVALLVLVLTTALPAYLSGQWPWSTPPQVSQLAALQTLQTTPLTLAGWQTQTHQGITINSRDWTVTEFVPAPDSAGDSTLPSSVVLPPALVVLLRPQPWHSDQPTVEWMDLRGVQRWRLSQVQRLRFAPTEGPGQVTAQLQRATAGMQDFALIQWYAWPGGGHFATGRWFWANQWSQWQHQAATPWVAVSLVVPLPMGADLASYEPWLAELGADIQGQLLAGPLAS